MIVTSLMPYIKLEYGLTDTQSGLLVSVVYWSIVVFVFPVSILVDRWSRKKTIGIMALIWSMATLACAFTKTFPQLLMTRSAIGIGEAGYAPAGTAMLSGLFPPEKRSRMMGLWNMSIPLGIAIGIGVGGFVAQHWGWRHAFGLVAIPGALIALLFFFVKDYKTVDLVQTVKSSKVKMSKMDIFRSFIRTPSLIFTYLGFIGCVFTNNAITTWLPTYYHRLEGIPLGEAGMKTGGILMLAVIGLPLGGWLADVWFKKRPSSRLLFPAIMVALSSVVVFVAFSFLEGKAQYMALLLYGILGVGFVAAAITATQETVHAGLRAISYSVCVIVQNILGASLGPIVIGAFSDAYGIKVAMTILPIFLVVSALLFFAGSFFYEKDLKKVEKVTLECES
jgi:MFS family permease